MASSYDSRKCRRQTLISGNYGPLNTVTFVPNPDYYSALLWHRLMGRNVLSTALSGTNKICAYAPCAIASVSRSIKLGLANKISCIMPSVLVITARNYIAVDQPRRKHTVKVHVSTENVASNGTLAIQQ
uniref:Uncharacterized protein n=1 Tax=Populus alba TaxID=43335 RepID=A0A4U5QNJ9_POPAL|nr:hypothetical protein D5086_0000068900 [Populus alba]